VPKWKKLLITKLVGLRMVSISETHCRALYAGAASLITFYFHPES